MNLKESQEYMGGFGERKRKGEVILLYHNVKNKGLIKSKTKQRFKVKAVLVMQREATV